MSRRLPPLNALRAFETAARLGSFTGAAEELHVSQGAVSRHVARLEAYLAVKLFLRNGKRVALTPEGQAYAGALGQALDDIHEATQRVSRGKDRKILRIRMLPTFAIRWLVPRLSSLHAVHRDLEVQITTTLHKVDFRREDVDVTIWYGATGEPGLQSTLLFQEHLVPVCSPSLFGSARLPRPLPDLRKRTLLHSMNRRSDWRLFFDAAGIDQASSKDLMFGTSALAYQAANDGVGIAIAQLSLVQDDIRAGRLAVPVDLSVRTDHGFWLSHPREYAPLAKIRTFTAWLLGEAEADRARQGQATRREVEMRRNGYPVDKSSNAG